MKRNLNPISISTHGSLILFGHWVKKVNFKGTVWEKAIMKWLDFKYDAKALFGKVYR